MNLAMLNRLERRRGFGMMRQPNLWYLRNLWKKFRRIQPQIPQIPQMGDAG